MTSLAKSLAKQIMKMRPAEPERDDISLFEVFNQRDYTTAAPDEQDRIKLRSAQYRYDSEVERDFFEQYFPEFDRERLRGRRLLDLGSFTGGRLIRWAQVYGLSRAAGIDIDPVFAEAGRLFAQRQNVEADFHVGYAEALPFADGEFDIIVSFDVFEHVQSVSKAMAECHRVLAPGGLLIAAFPQYLQPAESHLGLVTRVPALQWFFPGRVLAAAYHEIIQERGPEAYWYARESADLGTWERSPTLNGITVHRFRRIVKDEPDWRVVHWGDRPIFSGRAARSVPHRLVSAAFTLPARLPVLEELFLGRICCILEKRPA